MILNSQTMLSMYGIYYIKEDIFIPKKTKGFGLGADNEEQKNNPCPGRYYSHINDSEIIIILGLMYQSYTTGLTHKQTAVSNY